MATKNTKTSAKKPAKIYNFDEACARFIPDPDDCAVFKACFKRDPERQGLPAGQALPTDEDKLIGPDARYTVPSLLMMMWVWFDVTNDRRPMPAGFWSDLRQMLGEWLDQIWAVRHTHPFRLLVWEMTKAMQAQEKCPELFADIDAERWHTWKQTVAHSDDAKAFMAGKDFGFRKEAATGAEEHPSSTTRLRKPDSRRRRGSSRSGARAPKVA